MRRISNNLVSEKATVKALLLGCLLLFSSAIAQASSQYDVSWHTTDGGGGISSGGAYTLTGTIGQPDADFSSGGDYELLGGFWLGGPLCFVEFHHYARFAEHWLEAPCDAGNDWCGGADLDQLGDVDGVDLGLFVELWLLSCPYNWPLK